MGRITAIGEIIFDIYPDLKKLGGAPFNFIYHIHKLTGRGQFVSRVGNDELGQQAMAFLKMNNIPVNLVQVDTEHETGVAYANLDENKIPHWEIPLDLAYDFINIPLDAKNIVKDSDCFYFGSLSQRMEKSCATIQSLFDGDTKYFFDINIRQNYYTKKKITRSLFASDFLKVNEEELLLLHKMLFAGPFNIAECAGAIMENFKIELVAVTMGADGAFLFKGGDSDYFKVSLNKVVDTVGAGDAYSAILALGYLMGWDLKKINKLASEFAAQIVQMPGALPVDDLIYDRFRKYF